MIINVDYTLIFKIKPQRYCYFAEYANKTYKKKPAPEGASLSI